MSVRELVKKSRAKVHPVEISVGTVYVKSLTGEGRQRYHAIAKENDGVAPLHTIAAIALCEQNGDPCFPMATDKDIAVADAELKDMDGLDLQTICLKLFEISGLAKDAKEEAEKKSEGSQSE
jgi:hypothetical protein